MGRNSLEINTYSLPSNASTGAGSFSGTSGLMPSSTRRPDSEELERQFSKVLASMDLPPDKAKILRAYDDEKKWQMIKDQQILVPKDSPEHYLRKLRTYLDPKALKKTNSRKILGDQTSTQVLRDLEISLRTNSIEWVREFLSETNKGLDVLIEYLTFRLATQQQQQKEAQRQKEEALAQETNGSLRPNVMACNSVTRPPGLFNRVTATMCGLKNFDNEHRKSNLERSHSTASAILR